MSNLHIVTVATEPKYYFPYLVESCKRNGKNLEVLGMGEKWQGFNHKFNLMINYLQELPKNDIVCFVDGYDVLCLRNLNELKKKFISTAMEKKCKIIVAKDKHKNSFYDIIHSFIFDKCKNTNINSGTYIGYVKDLLDVLVSIYKKNPENSKDDQKLLTEYCKNNESKFYIDEKNDFFFTQLTILHEIDEYVSIKNNVVSVNGYSPFFIHVPSGYLDNLIIKLGYNYDYNNKVKNTLFIELFTNKIWKSVLKDYIVYIIIILFIIFIIYFFYKKKHMKFLNLNFKIKNKKFL